ncbi:hypothetical protein DV706_14240 [Natronorubrum bangense]|uniref:Uncharacterized protein n=1 Tax=Natronorubrum bangense TaxID=61858 RepID=A0A4D6HS00_9EURY|nr:hypothetical protein DV706_14240 [Natronorubrum bangense]
MGLFTVNRAVSAEYACTVKAPLEEIETFLHEAGYDRNVLAGLKYRGDRADEDYEVTSWAKRVSGSPLIPDALAFWQTHVWVFDNQDGTFDLYAHYEYSSMNPTIAYQHLRAIGMDRERGVKEIKQDLIGDPFTHYVL